MFANFQIPSVTRDMSGFRASGASRSPCGCVALRPSALIYVVLAAHIAESALLQSPFDYSSPLDDDLDFACRAMIGFGPWIRTWREAQLRALRKLSKVLRPWEAEAVSQMPATVARVASRKRPVFMLACTLLLRWPDETNALRYILGFPIVGDIEHTGLFRQLEVDCAQPTGLDVLLGASAVANLRDCLHRVRPSEHDAALLAMTLQEVADGFADGPFDEEELNAMFGRGGWRPLERFVHVQSCGKLRCIDSGKKSGHNRASRESETIFATTVDVIPAFARRACSLARQLQGPGEHDLPEWFSLVLGTEDMKNAYRQCPILPAHRCCSVIAFWHCHSCRVKYIVLNGLPFGLSSAVLSFNRTPALLTAVARRFTGSAVAFFFDDSCVLDLAAGHGQAQAALREVYALMGAVLDPDKSQAPAGCRAFLGLSVNVAKASVAGVVEFELKDGFREVLQQDIDTVLQEGILSSGRAAKLRGKLGWSASERMADVLAGARRLWSAVSTLTRWMCLMSL